MENCTHRRLRGSTLGAIFAVTTLLSAVAVLASCGNAPIIQESATPQPEASASPGPSAAPTAVPAAPVAQAKAGTAQVTVTWADVATASSYNLYWRAGAGVTKANGALVSGASSPYMLPGLVNGTSYSVIVTAVNAIGESEVSVQASAQPLAAPARVTPTSGLKHVGLSWWTVTGATGYNVYWSTTSGTAPETGAKVSVAGASTNAYAHAGLVGGTRYFYVVTAVNATGESAPTAEASAWAFKDSYHSAQAASAASGSGASAFSGVAVDKSGDRIAAGYQNGGALCAYGPAASVAGGNASGSNAVVVKYDSAGSAVWAKSVAGTGIGASGFRSVAVDASGNVYAAGYVYGSATYDFGGGQTVTGRNAGANTFVLVKYDADGNAVWAASASTGSPETGFSGVAVDAAGNAYAAGYVFGSTAFKLSGTITVQAAASGLNAFMAKYDANGVPLWGATTASGSVYSQYNGVSVDASGNAYAGGFVGGNTTVGFGNGVSANGANSNSGQYSSVLVKYAAGGAAQWARSVTTNNASSAFSVFGAVAVDKATNAVYAAGRISGTTTYTYGGSAAIAGVGLSSDYVSLVKYDADGNALWAATDSIPNYSSSYSGVAVDGSGNCYACGYVNGNVQYDFGYGNAVSAAYSSGNAVLAKYDPSGKTQWVQSTTTASGDSRFAAVAADPDGTVHAAGTTTGTATIDLGGSGSASGGASGTSSLVARYAP